MSAKRKPIVPAAVGDTSEWWRGAVIYQIYPRSFLDSNKDGIGDLPGIAAKLDYVASLGVDGLWISPFFTSPMADFGYDVADYRDVDPEFGSLGDFRWLLAKAHELGLKVIIDQVYSHTSNQHGWFQESRQDIANAKADWYVWADAKADGSPPNNWQSVFAGPAWTWDNRRKQYYLHNFLPEQPDLNLHHPQVRQALLDVARFWLELGVDGFRLDAINFGMHDEALKDNPPAKVTDARLKRPYHMQRHLHNMSHQQLPGFLEAYRQCLAPYGEIFTVAEVGGDDPFPVMQRYTAGLERLCSAYSFELLGQTHLGKAPLAKIIGQWSNDPAEGWPSWALSNHDVRRVASRCFAERPEPDESPARYAKLSLLLLMSLRGNIFLYQGEELGLPQGQLGYEELQDPEALCNWPDDAGRDGARTPMPWVAEAPFLGFSEAQPWLPAQESHRALAVDRQQAAPGSTLAFCKEVVALRAATPCLRLGRLDLVDAQHPCLTIQREHQGQRLAAVFNFTEETQPLPTAYADWRPLIASTPLAEAGLPAFAGVYLSP